MMKKIGTENRSLAIVIWRGEGEQEGEERTGQRTEDGEGEGRRRRGGKTGTGKREGGGNNRVSIKQRGQSQACFRLWKEEAGRKRKGGEKRSSLTWRRRNSRASEKDACGRKGRKSELRARERKPEGSRAVPKARLTRKGGGRGWVEGKEGGVPRRMR